MLDHSQENSVYGRNSKTAGNSVHFLTLNSLSEIAANSLKEYANILSDLHDQFEARFQDFTAPDPRFELSSTPFAMDIESATSDMQMELVDLQCGAILIICKYATVEHQESGRVNGG